MKTFQFFVLISILSTCRAHPTTENSWKTLDGRPPKLFGHRGERALMPENTIAAFELASILGADYVEPDLCLTRDNYLVCFHDVELGSDTDVKDHPEFEHLKHRTSSGGYDWYVQNFTLAQLRTLKVVQKNVGIRPQYLNFFGIPTFVEYLDTVHRMTYKLNRTIGVIPELKSVHFHNSADHREIPYAMEQLVLATLSSYGYPVNSTSEGNCSANVDGARIPIPCPPVILQCFELKSLEYLKTNSKFELLYITDMEPEYLTYEGIKKIAAVASHYNTYKEYIYIGVEAYLAHNNFTWNASLVNSLGGFIQAQDFVSLAHRHGMEFGVHTVYDSREPSSYACANTTYCKSNKTAELRYLFSLGIDSAFVENVAESREILIRYDNDRVNGKLAGGAVHGLKNNFL